MSFFAFILEFNFETYSCAFLLKKVCALFYDTSLTYGLLFTETILVDSSKNSEFGIETKRYKGEKQRKDERRRERLESTSCFVTSCSYPRV